MEKKVIMKPLTDWTPFRKSLDEAQEFVKALTREIKQLQASEEALRRRTLLAEEERDVLKLQVNGAIRAAIGLGGSVVPSLSDVALERVTSERDEAIEQAKKDAGAKVSLDGLIAYIRSQGGSFSDENALDFIHMAVKSCLDVSKLLKEAAR